MPVEKVEQRACVMYGKLPSELDEEDAGTIFLHVWMEQFEENMATRPRKPRKPRR